MRKIIFLTVAIWTVLTTVYGQDKEYQYHPWSEFKEKNSPYRFFIEVNGDTTEFLLRNFHYQRTLFAGKSLGTVFEILDKEMSVKKIAYITKYPENNTLNGIDLIFDERTKWNELGQLHFYIFGFDREYSIDELRIIFGNEPNTLIPFNKKLRQRITSFIFDTEPTSLIFSPQKLPDPSTLSPAVLQQSKSVESFE